MRAEIKALQQRLASMMIYVTHDQIEAMTMADKIVVLHDGKVEQIGTPLDLYDFAGQPVRGRVHRLAGDELLQRASRRRRAADACNRLRVPDFGWPPRRPSGPARRSSWASAPST